MNERAVIGGNNPPEEERLAMLTPAEDLEKIVGEEIQKFAELSDTLLSTCSRVPVTVPNQEVYDKVVALIAAMRQLVSDKEESRKKHKEPYLKAGQEVDRLFKLTNDKKEDRSKLVEKAITDLTTKLSDYDTAEYEKRRKAAEEDSRKLAETALKDGIEVPAEKVEVKLESRKSEHGGTSTKTIVREWVVSDEEALPRSVLSVDPKKVQALVDKGASIPGITVTERVETVVKRS